MNFAQKMLVAVAGASLAAAPVAAAPVERTSQEAEDANEFAGTGIIFVLAAIAVAVLAVVAFNNDGDDPVSP